MNKTRTEGEPQETFGTRSVPSTSRATTASPGSSISSRASGSTSGRVVQNSTPAVVNPNTGSVQKKKCPFGRMPGYVEKPTSLSSAIVEDEKPISTSVSASRTGRNGSRPVANQQEEVRTFRGGFLSPRYNSGQQDTTSYPVVEFFQVTKRPKPTRSLLDEQFEQAMKKTVTKPPAVEKKDTRVPSTSTSGSGNVQTRPVIRNTKEAKAEMSALVNAHFDNLKAEASNRLIEQLTTTSADDSNVRFVSPAEMDEYTRTTSSSSLSSFLSSSGEDNLSLDEMMKECSLDNAKINGFFNQVKSIELQQGVKNEERDSVLSSVDSSMVTVVKNIPKNAGESTRGEAGPSTTTFRTLPDTFGNDNRMVGSSGVGAKVQKKQPEEPEKPEELDPSHDFSDDDYYSAIHSDDDYYSAISDNIGNTMNAVDIEMQLRELEKIQPTERVIKKKKNESSSIPPQYQANREMQHKLENTIRVSEPIASSSETSVGDASMLSMITKMRNVIDKALREKNWKVFHQKMVFLYQMEEDDAANSAEWKKCIDYYNSKIKH